MNGTPLISRYSTKEFFKRIPNIKMCEYIKKKYNEGFVDVYHDPTYNHCLIGLYNNILYINNHSVMDLIDQKIIISSSNFDLIIKNEFLKSNDLIKVFINKIDLDQWNKLSNFKNLYISKISLDEEMYDCSENTSINFMTCFVDEDLYIDDKIKEYIKPLNFVKNFSTDETIFYNSIDATCIEEITSKIPKLLVVSLGLCITKKQREYLFRNGILCIKYFLNSGYILEINNGHELAKSIISYHNKNKIQIDYSPLEDYNFFIKLLG